MTHLLAYLLRLFASFLASTILYDPSNSMYTVNPILTLPLIFAFFMSQLCLNLLSSSLSTNRHFFSV